MKITEDNVRRIIREELLRLMEQEDPKAPSIDDLDFMSGERADYETWAHLNRYTTTSVRSTLVDYIVQNELQGNEDLRKSLSKELGFDDSAVEKDIQAKSHSDSDDENARELDLAQVVEAISRL